MSVQFIRTPNGDEMAVIPRDEYEDIIRSISRRENRNAYEKLERSNLKPEQKIAIKEIMDQGNSLLKAVRKWRGHTQMYVQEFRTTLGGVSQSYLADLESGKRSGTSEVLRMLANIYQVPKDLFAGDE